MAPAGRQDPIRVLLVEDHLMFAQSLARVLETEADIEVVDVVVRVAECADAVRDLRPDVVLMDYRLPDGDGVRATIALRAEFPGLCVVMLTGMADDTVLVHAIEAGCAGFVSKEEPAMRVVEAVRAAATGEAVVPPALLTSLLPRLRRDYRGVGDDLTRREVEVLDLMASGRSNKEIAAHLGLSNHTVRNHVSNLLAKLGAHSRLEAVAIAVREGVIHRD